MQAEHAQLAKERTEQAESGKSVENGFSKPTTVEEFTTSLVHLLQYTPFR